MTTLKAAISSPLVTLSSIAALLAGTTLTKAASLTDNIPPSPSIYETGKSGQGDESSNFAPQPLALGYARAGWQATLSTFAHNVSGIVTILDADTFRIDNFVYDGGGINVHFILAAADNNSTFRNSRLVTDLNLLGTPHNGDSLTIDLPTGTNFDSYNAISLWCIPASANFGSGTFTNTASVPEPSAVTMLALGTAALCLIVWRRPKRIGR